MSRASKEIELEVISMLKSIFDKGIFNSLNFDNAPKLCKEMESQRIDMTALEFMCAVPIIVTCLDLSKKEQMAP